jgi:hypothetical protein
MRIIIAFISAWLILSCQINGHNYSSNDDSKKLSTDSLKCNIDVVAQMSKSIENPDKTDLLNFLYTFDETCSLNAEYSEFSNEVLFKVAQKYPRQVLELLSNKKVKTQVILKELKSPISDTYNAVDIKDFIEKVEDIQNQKKE